MGKIIQVSFKKNTISTCAKRQNAALLLRKLSKRCRTYPIKNLKKVKQAFDEAKNSSFYLLFYIQPTINPYRSLDLNITSTLSSNKICSGSNDRLRIIGKRRRKVWAWNAQESNKIELKKERWQAPPAFKSSIYSSISNTYKIHHKNEKQWCPKTRRFSAVLWEKTIQNAGGKSKNVGLFWNFVGDFLLSLALVLEKSPRASINQPKTRHKESIYYILLCLFISRLLHLKR